VIELAGGVDEEGASNLEAIDIATVVSSDVYSVKVSSPSPIILTDALPSMLNILLIDDSTASNKLLARRFKLISKDIQVTCANNGESALALLENTTAVGFDLIIIDENMQSTGGILLGHEVVLIMRHTLNLDRTVIFGCTGNALTCREDFANNGADGVWSKPTPDNASMILAINVERAKYLGGRASGLPCRQLVAVIDDCCVNSKILVRRLSK
jgi:CheY-like chemotaxis protein